MKVVFRTCLDREGETIAVFPEEPADVEGRCCSSYMYNGQHGIADTYIVMGKTRPATFEEALPLYEELQEVGYKALEPIGDFNHELAREARRKKVAGLEEVED